MTLAKSSLEVARGYLELVPDVGLRDGDVRARSSASTSLLSSAVLRASGVERLLDRQPVVQRTIDLRNPYVDPMNAIQIEMLAGSAPATRPHVCRSSARSRASRLRCETRASGRTAWPWPAPSCPGSDPSHVPGGRVGSRNSPRLPAPHKQGLERPRRAQAWQGSDPCHGRRGRVFELSAALRPDTSRRAAGGA